MEVMKLQNIKCKIKKKKKKSDDTYEKFFKLLHSTLIYADGKYIKPFIGVKTFVEENLKHRVLDVRLSIHANELTSKVVHERRFNVPSVNEISILMPESYDVTTKDHNR